MTQPDLFGPAVTPARQPHRADLPLLLAASADHALGGALPVAKTTRVVKVANDYVQERLRMRSDPRDIVKGLVQHHGALLTYPSYRTALRCGHIYSEAATSCGMATARILVASFAEKAERYLAGVERDLFADATQAETPEQLPAPAGGAA